MLRSRIRCWVRTWPKRRPLPSTITVNAMTVCLYLASRVSSIVSLRSRSAEGFACDIFSSCPRICDGVANARTHSVRRFGPRRKQIGLLVTCTTRIGTSADGSCRGDRGARRKSMSSHRRRLATKISPATHIGPRGCGETALSSSSSAPHNVGAFPRRRLLEENAVWPQRWSRFGWYRPLLNQDVIAPAPGTNDQYLPGWLALAPEQA